jgi:hypothetical protein
MAASGSRNWVGGEGAATASPETGGDDMIVQDTPIEQLLVLQMDLPIYSAMRCRTAAQKARALQYSGGGRRRVAAVQRLLCHGQPARIQLDFNFSTFATRLRYRFSVLWE